MSVITPSATFRQAIPTDPAPMEEVETLSITDENGNARFRRLVQRLTPYIRAGAAPAAPKPLDTKPEDRLHVFGRRWSGGERITLLAKEAGTSWNRLWGELTALGYKKGA